MTGIVAAEPDFTGIPGLLGFGDYRDWVETLGDDYIMVNGVDFKQHCSCGWGHMAIAAVQTLQRDHDRDVTDIAAIRIEGHHWTAVLRTAHPTTTEDARFSVKWPLASWLIDGEVGPGQILEERFDDGRITALVDTIVLIESQELDNLYRAGVEIRLADGRVVDACRIEARGDEERLERKFRWLTGTVLEEEQADRVLDMLWRFDTVEDVSDSTSGMTSATKCRPGNPIGRRAVR